MPRTLIIFFVVGAVLGAAKAQSKEDKAKFVSEDMDARIAGCTRLINSRRLSSEDRATAFNNRGIAYKSKGEYDRAIQDYDAAIQLNPNFPAAYSNRGVAYRNKDQYDRAIQDYDDAQKTVAQFDQGGFALPGRDFYLSDDAKSVEIRKKYQQHVANMLPFQWTFGFPIEALIGKLSTQQLIAGLGIQALWIAIGSLLVAVLWRFSVRRYSAVGN